MASPADTRLRELVQAIFRYKRQRHADDGVPKYRKALDDYVTEMRRRVASDEGAERALKFLQSKKRQRAAKDGKLLPPSDDILPSILAVLPLGYRMPPARARKADIGRQERFAVKLRGLAKELERGLESARRFGPRDYFAPRKWKGARVQIADCAALEVPPELESLPAMLEQYASCVERKARILRDCAKQEPTEKQWRQDAEARLVRWAKGFTGGPHHEKVAALLEALRPSPKGNGALGRSKAETLRKRAYRLTKPHP
jgi:hypothetical protein